MALEEEIVHPSLFSWTITCLTLPDEGIVVDTVIADENGVRNNTPLKRSGNLWFYPDGSGYVYYTPTHWKYRETVVSNLAHLCRGCYEEFDFITDFNNHRCSGDI